MLKQIFLENLFQRNISTIPMLLLIDLIITLPFLSLQFGSPSISIMAIRISTSPIRAAWWRAVNLLDEGNKI